MFKKIFLTIFNQLLLQTPEGEATVEDGSARTLRGQAEDDDGPVVGLHVRVHSARPELRSLHPGDVLFLYEYPFAL
jgi:hypothetical protein